MSNERMLEELAYGEDWQLTNLNRMIAAVASLQRKVDEVIATLPAKWHGDAAELALRRFRVHQINLGKIRNALNGAQALITGTSETSCAATCANSTRKMEAERLLSNLSSGVVPSWVHDAVNRGMEIEVPFFGKVDLNQGAEDLANWLGARREEEAAKALETMAEVIRGEKNKFSSLSFEFDPLPTSTGEPQEIPPFEVAPTSPGGESGDGWPGGGPGGPGWPGGGPGGPGDGGGGPGDGGGGPGGPGDGGGGPGDGGGGPGEPPSEPPLPPPYEPPVYPPYEPPNDPDGPGGNGGGGGTGGGTGGGGPSVDSRLDGSTLRSGLGAAGLGAAGLAAGAKLAGAGGAGGLAQGLGLTGGPGLQGAASAASAGGGSGSGSGSPGAGRGMRPGGMMMGGAGAGGAEEKKPKSGLGGYLAPKLEDEDEGGPAARASRAGSRDGS